MQVCMTMPMQQSRLVLLGWQQPMHRADKVFAHKSYLMKTGSYEVAVCSCQLCVDCPVLVRLESLDCQLPVIYEAQGS